MTELNAEEATVRIDGVSVAFESVRVRSEIASDVALFTGGNGLVEAEADVTWAPPRGLMTTSEHPWLPSWNKSVGRTVTIDVDGLGDTTWRVFTGTITDTHANLGDGTVTSTCTGYETRLNREVSVPPVAFTMPALGAGGANYRRPGMTAMWVTGHILAQCGFWPHQPWHAKRMVAVSMMGSLWPETGTLRAGYSNSRGSDLPPVAASTAWGGVGLEDPYGVFDGGFAGSINDPWTLVVDLGDPDPLDEIYVAAQAPSDEGFRLVITGSSIKVQSHTIADGWVDELEMTRDPRTTRAVAQYIGGALEIYLDVNAPGEPNPLPAEVALNMTFLTGTVTVDAQSGVVGAVQLHRDANPLTHDARTAVFRRDTSVTTIGACRYMKGNALDLLVEQSKRERIPMWVDAHGVFHCADRATLDAGPVRHLFADAPGLLRDLWTLPGNRFTDPLPESTDDFDEGPDTLAGVTQGPTLPYLSVVNAGSTASTLGRYVETVVPVTPGATESWSVQARCPDGVGATIHVEFIPHSGSGFVSGASRTGGFTNSQTWETITVTAEVPIESTQARIRVGNAGSMPFNTSLHFRGFTTLGRAAALEAISARTSSRDTYGRVVVEGLWSGSQGPHLNKYPRLPLAQGSSTTWSGDMLDPVTEFYTAADNEDWLHVDLDWRFGREINNAGGADDWNFQRGSWVGGHFVDNTTGDAAEVNGSKWVGDDNMVASVSLVDPNTIAFTFQYSTASSDIEVVTKANPDSTAAWTTRKDITLPVFRGMGKLVWVPVDATVEELSTTGPDYIIDMGWWGQSQARREAVAAEAAAHLEAPQPVLEGVQVGLTPVELGERVVLHLTDVAGLTIDAVVIARDVDLTESGTGVDVRVLDAEVTNLTYQQVEGIGANWFDELPEGV